MPKKTYNERIKKHQAKINKLRQKQRLRHQRLNSPASSLASATENEPQPEYDVVSISTEAEKSTQTSPIGRNSDPVDTTEDDPRFGKKIHDNLARLCIPILKKGLDNNCKESLKKKYPIPENCSLLQAPKLNTEVDAIISDAMKEENKKMEDKQQHLGLGIAALSQGITFLLGEEAQKLKAINFFFDSCRLLSDLHFKETIMRRELMMPKINESLMDITLDVERDDTLFGQNISEKTKASKNILPQSRKGKKSVATKAGAKVGGSSQPSTSQQRFARHTTLSSAGRDIYKSFLIEPTEPTDETPQENPQ